MFAVICVLNGKALKTHVKIHSYWSVPAILFESGRSQLRPVRSRPMVWKMKAAKTL